MSILDTNPAAQINTNNPSELGAVFVSKSETIVPTLTFSGQACSSLCQGSKLALGLHSTEQRPEACGCTGGCGGQLCWTGWQCPQVWDRGMTAATLIICLWSRPSAASRARTIWCDITSSSQAVLICAPAARGRIALLWHPWRIQDKELSATEQALALSMASLRKEA